MSAIKLGTWNVFLTYTIEWRRNYESIHKSIIDASG